MRMPRSWRTRSPAPRASRSSRGLSRPIWCGSPSTRPMGTAAEVAAYLRSRGILVSVPGAQVIRACTHLDVTTEQVEHAAQVIRDIEPALISAMTLVY